MTQLPIDYRSGRKFELPSGEHVRGVVILETKNPRYAYVVNEDGTLDYFDRSDSIAALGPSGTALQMSDLVSRMTQTRRPLSSLGQHTTKRRGSCRAGNIPRW